MLRRFGTEARDLPSVMAGMGVTEQEARRVLNRLQRAGVCDGGSGPAGCTALAPHAGGGGVRPGVPRAAPGASAGRAHAAGGPPPGGRGEPKPALSLPSHRRRDLRILLSGGTDHRRARPRGPHCAEAPRSGNRQRGLPPRPPLTVLAAPEPAPAPRLVPVAGTPRGIVSRGRKAGSRPASVRQSTPSRAAGKVGALGTILP
jgi:hypothetical protein